MPAAPTFVSGIHGLVTINSNVFYVEQFDYEEQTTLDDITYTKSGGATWKILLPQYSWATGTLTFVWDSSNKPTVSPYDLRAGTLLALILSPDQTNNYTFNAYSGNFRYGSGPKAGTVRCTCRYESTDAVTQPT